MTWEGQRIGRPMLYLAPRVVLCHDLTSSSSDSVLAFAFAFGFGVGVFFVQYHLVALSVVTVCRYTLLEDNSIGYLRIEYDLSNIT